MDPELLHHLRCQADDRRTHAAFFAWYDRSAEGKGISETGVVRTLLESRSAAGMDEYREPRPSGDQWPDCWANAVDGKAVPFEVSELLDATAIPAGPARPWTPAQIRQRIQESIKRKDLRSLSRPGSGSSVLVLHTDEIYLDIHNVSAALEGHRFSLEHGNIGRAFLLFSYDPGSRGYPFIELPLAA